jgi:glycosyltransferase involved in cell wall biosynthesis
MNYSPLVSVIIPAYNASAWITETISSVLEQDFNDYEIIVVNDGSTDETADVIASFGDKVKCIHKKNGGQASARNAGIKIAKGKYIAFLDSDDLWIKEKLKLQLELIKTSDVKWVYSDAIAFDNHNKKPLYKFSEISKQYNGDILKSIFKSCFIPSPTPIIQSTVFSEVGLFNENSSMRNREDWEMWIRIASIYPIALIPAPLAYYRVHSANSTSRESLYARMIGNIAVIEEAALRESKRLGPIKNSVLSMIYFSYGLTQALEGNESEARKMFYKSILQTPFQVKLYIYWVLTPFLPWLQIQRNKIYKRSLIKFV